MDKIQEAWEKHLRRTFVNDIDVKGFKILFAKFDFEAGYKAGQDSLKCCGCCKWWKWQDVGFWAGDMKNAHTTCNNPKSDSHEYYVDPEGQCNQWEARE
jgi:hypothetical protein